MNAVPQELCHQDVAESRGPRLLYSIVAAATAITAAICWRRLRFSRLVPS